jgi:hypothetical protein
MLINPSVHWSFFFFLAKNNPFNYVRFLLDTLIVANTMLFQAVWPFSLS